MPRVPGFAASDALGQTFSGSTGRCFAAQQRRVHPGLLSKSLGFATSRCATPHSGAASAGPRSRRQRATSTRRRRFEAADVGAPARGHQRVGATTQPTCRARPKAKGCGTDRECVARANGQSCRARQTSSGCARASDGAPTPSSSQNGKASPPAPCCRPHPGVTARRCVSSTTRRGAARSKPRAWNRRAPSRATSTRRYHRRRRRFRC